MSPVFSVSDFVGSVNQTLDYAYATVTIVGELANFRISKGKWVYFDLKDEQASVRFFGTIYNLPGPLEDGMVLEVTGTPRLHPAFGFSVTVQSLRPVGEGTIKRAANLLQAKLAAEGIFEVDRKRTLPYPPARIGLIASGESAAYHDFIKVIGQRWRGIAIAHVDVQVQGEAAPAQIIQALERLNTESSVEVIVLTRGGGSPEDLAAFSTEQVVRTVAASRIPTMIAIGHEVDVSLAELAADVRASTPSNAAELLVPDQHAVVAEARSQVAHRKEIILHTLASVRSDIAQTATDMQRIILHVLQTQQQQLLQAQQLLQGYNPQRILRQGYALVRKQKALVTSVQQLAVGDTVLVQLLNGTAHATIISVDER